MNWEAIWVFLAIFVTDYSCGMHNAGLDGSRFFWGR
jgi:hypothetical protein